MTERWHRTRDLVGLPGMPNGPRPIRLHGERRGWVSREASWGSRVVLEWLESSLPPETQDALRLARGETPRPAGAAEGGVSTSVQAEGSPSAVSLPDDGCGARADARADIVSAFDRWRAPRGLALVPAYKQFSDLYRAGEIDVSAATRSLIASFSWNTLQRWHREFRARGVVGLLPGAGGRRSTIDADEDFRETAAALVLANPNHVTARQIGRALRARFPDREPPGIDSIRRWARGWRAAHKRELSAVADPDGHRSRRMPAFGDGGEMLVDGLNSLWELDSTLADVMCADGKRYALVAAIDVWSRRVKCYVTRSSRAGAIAALIRRCLLDWGVPGWVRTDEGSDYTSRHLRHALLDLGVGHEVLPPYSPDLKPFIERVIGTISRDLFSQLPGFTGHNVAEAAKLRARKSFAARRGEQPVATFKCSLTPEQLQERIDAWCEHVYGREEHSGLAGMSPFAKAASWAGERRAVDERALDALLAEPVSGGGTRTVQKTGLDVEGGTYIAAELGPLVGERVHVRREPADYGRVYVFEIGPNDALGPFVCIAEDPLRTGIDRQEVARQAKRLAREADREARKWARDLARDRSPATAIDDVLAHAAAASEQLVAFPAPAERHESQSIAAAAEAADALAEADAPEPRKTGTVAHIDVLKKFYLEGGA